MIPIKPESSNFSEKVIRIPVRRAVEEGTHDLPDAESPDSLSNGAANKALPIPDPDERHALARQLVDASASGEEVRARLMELEAQHRNVLADSDNFRKRIEREARQQILNEKRAFLLELLEIMDNFERALRINPDGNDAWRQGVEATHGQMVELLERHGVRPIETLGKPFDPNYHEAMSTSYNPDVKDGTVVNEIRKGYLLNGELLRPSRVQVTVRP